MGLATQFRPTTFADVVGQDLVVKVLQKQATEKKISNCYLFAGPSGTGKTTLARIFANAINDGIGKPIEIDAASNNGVDTVRALIESASERAIDGSTYKVYIIDEAHMITTAGWNAFLKCIEEPPKYTVFIFCTTEPNKLPETIINRLTRFNLNKIQRKELVDRLFHVACNSCGGLQIDMLAIDQIALASNGCMREALNILEKAQCFMTEKNGLDIKAVEQSLGKPATETMFNLVDAIFDKNYKDIISIIDSVEVSGLELKLFIDNLVDFVLDLVKYVLFRDLSIIKINQRYEEKIKYSTGIRQNANEIVDVFTVFLNKLLELKLQIRNDPLAKDIIEITLLNISKEN